MNKISSRLSMLAAALIVFLFSCDKDNENTPKKTSLLTLNVEASYPASDQDDWILVHGEKGDLLASQSFEPNQELDIITDKPLSGKITVTLLTYKMDKDGVKRYMAMSHSNIEKGESMILKGAKPSNSAQETGKVTVHVSDVVSPKFQWLGCPVSGYSSGGWSSETNVASIQTSAHAGFSKYLATVLSGNSLKYKMLTNVKANDLFNFSFIDMDPINKKVSFTFPQPNTSYLSVRGSDPSEVNSPNTYLVIFAYLSTPHTTVEAGYPDVLTNYLTELTLFYSDYSYMYSNIGSIPSPNIAWPQKSDFNISEKSISNFSSTASKPYVWRQSSWSLDDKVNKFSIYWNLSSSSGSQLINELPSEITNVHPDLSFKNLKYNSTTFYTDAPSYESWVNYNFGSEPQPVGTRLGIQIYGK